METNDHKIRDYSATLNAKFDEEAYTFYTSKIILDARKKAHLTQEELAKRIGAD